MDNVLVTGGLGVIGAFVCRALLATGRHPIIYDKSNDVALIRDIAPDCVIENGITCDLRRLTDVIAEHRPVAIAHLAGWTGSRVQQDAYSAIDVNLMGTVTVFEAARLAGIQRIVFASSRQVYGPIGERHRHPHYEPVSEQHPREPTKLYGVLKRACEDIADHYAHTHSLDIIALRSGSVYGPRRFNWQGPQISAVHAAIESAVAGRPYSIDKGADQGDDLCYVGDGAQGFIAALDGGPQRGACRVYNISAGKVISLREMIAILEDLYPSWHAEAGHGLDYDGTGPGYYFGMATDKAQAELGFKSRFDFRRAVIDYAATLRRLKES